MTKIKDIITALNLFEEASIKHAEATKEGNYTLGNKNYDKVVMAVSYLKEHSCLNELIKFLNHNAIGVRLAAATFLLPVHEEEGIEILEKISKSTDFFSFIAETTLSEWRKGNLKL